MKSSKGFLYISLIADIIIAVSKFTAAAFTGSSSMRAEGIHSVIDGCSQLMLIWGVRSSRKQPDAARPFGYGRELYFWSFMVSLVIFILGGCISVYEGLQHLQHPEAIDHPGWNYIILAISFVFTCIALNSALKAFNKQRGDMPFWEAINCSKDPATFISLLGDVGDVLGLIIAFIGVFLGHYFNNPYYDGVASMVIGVMMILISMVLVRESKSLLMGETPSRKHMRTVMALVESDPDIIKVKKHRSIYLAPEEILLQINAIFATNLNTGQITDAIQRITKTIQKQFPRIKQIVIEPVAR